MKIALAHDSFTQMGGAERVVDALHELFPEAPVFTLAFDPEYKEKYKGWDIRTSRLQTLYLALGKLQYLLPVIPWGVDSLDFEGFDVVISSSSGFIKNIRVPKNCVHINYCHTPTRFLWSDANYVKQEVSFIIRPIIKLLLASMKKWDYRSAQRVARFIANSKEVQKRIKNYYNRDSQVIYPFVDTEYWKPTTDKGNYFLLSGRLQAHKRNDLIIEIFNDLKIPLHVVGTGRQENYLKSIAKPNIQFLGRISDNQLRNEYSGARALLFPQIEDFGLTPLEAAACGTPTLAYAQGGALETVVPGITGELFGSYDREKIKQIILNWNPGKYQVTDLRTQAEKFSKEKFKTAIQVFVNNQ
jgi:glycosyltransferase involved in cell wall biosynthesis